MRTSRHLALRVSFMTFVAVLLAYSVLFAGTDRETPRQILENGKTLERRQEFPQAIVAYRKYLRLRPEDDEVRGTLAKLLSWQGAYKEATSLYRDILTRHPIDLEIRTALARVLSWQRQFGEARALYERVLRENPEYWDARRGLADIDYWTGDYAHALRLYETLVLDRQDPAITKNIQAIKAELAALTQGQALRAPVGVRTILPTLPFRDYLKVGYTHLTYTNQFPDERDWLLEASKSLGAQTLVGRVEPLNRFGFHDTPISGELYSTLWKKAWGYVGGSAAINPHFVPNVTVGGELYQGLSAVFPSLSFLESSIGYRHMEFRSRTIDLVIPGLIIYFPHNIWITEKVYYVPSTGSTTLSSQITWRPTDRVQAYFNAGFGTTGEHIVATQDFTRVTTRILRGGVIFPLSEHFSGEFVGYYQDRETLYVQRGGTFNLIYHW